MTKNSRAKWSPSSRGAVWVAGMALAVLAAVTLGRCGELPEDGCAESGISVGNEFVSPDGLHACICELDGTLVCHRTGADAGPSSVAGTAADREHSGGTD